MVTAAGFGLTAPSAGCYESGVVHVGARADSPAGSADAELVRAAADGDREALAQLYDRHGSLLLALGTRMLKSRREAEDLLHDVFLEVWRHAKDYDESRGTVRSWMLLRLRSRALDRLKSAGYSRVVSMEASGIREENLVAETESGPGPDGARVREALAALPPDQRTVLEQAYFEGRSLSEIAERSGVPLGTVKSRLARALGKLREVLDADADRVPHGGGPR
jgi:RNA polymerase sigma-70 factor (ECF subfamily)